jgi:ATP-dependent helicase HrpB
MCWLDPPPKGPWQQAMDLLKSLGAIEMKATAAVLTPHGQAMSTLPVHPRLAHLLLCGAKTGFDNTAALLASLLSERDPFSRDSPDIGYRLDILSGETACPREQQGWLHRTRQLARQFEEQLCKSGYKERKPMHSPGFDQAPGYLLACAYPDRIARQRHSGGYQLANGRSANLVGEYHLGNNRWLAVAEVSGIVGGKGDSIRSAAALDENLFSTLLSDLVGMETIAEWNKKTNRFVAEEQQKIGALILKRTSLNSVPAAAKTSALIQHIHKQGLKLLPWTAELHQWCARASLLRSIEGDANWPDVSQATLLATVEDWLAPYLDEVNLLQDFKKLKLKDSLEALLSWEQRQRLNQLAPLRLQVPSGSSIAIDYTETPPVLAVKLQEMFGCEQSPTVVAGKVPLVVHLLSPAGRPLQITQDLAGFWRSSYHDVKKEMKGRYPKHPWPDDPLSAIATRKTRVR